MSSKNHLRSIDRIIVALIAISLFVAVDALAYPGERAAAADPAEWDADCIIDDRIFYDSTSMSAADVQPFMNVMMPSCRAGYTCLRNYRQVIDSRPADRYCAGYSGGYWETSAQIVHKVARSCGINHRVLLVLLQKEQSLVTSTGPSARQFSAATGQGCPDTAACDPATAGFSYQVYYAARKHQIYRLNPDSFGYRAQRWNNILFIPNRGCGTQSVFVYSQATAGLYISTPYTPNAAALNNLYGTRAVCSSYGNRHFWRLVTDWFGNPRFYEVHPRLAPFYNAAGGASRRIGVPT